MKRRQVLTLACALGACSLALAQSYPSKVIKLQVPFAPGGTTDVVARIIAEPLGKALGQNVIVENKAGGGGIVGAKPGIGDRAGRQQRARKNIGQGCAYHCQGKGH